MGLLDMVINGDFWKNVCPGLFVFSPKILLFKIRIFII